MDAVDRVESTQLLMNAMRYEYDSLGPVSVPNDRYYGAQTMRAIENFSISGTTLARYPTFLRGLAFVKIAAARANAAVGLLDKRKLGAIESAAEDILSGSLTDHFPIDIFQGGAGTSCNMNVNEVLANRGLEILGYDRGDYVHLHPNDDINIGQSTNDVCPTALRIGILLAKHDLRTALDRLATTFQTKADRFSHVLKLGRTQLQDAVPITVGQELGAYASAIRRDHERLGSLTGLLEVNLGGTAIGTGINAGPAYQRIVVEQLATLSRYPLRPCANLIEGTWDVSTFVEMSSALKLIALKLSKIANDMRLLSSGPRGGIGEIKLPSVQPGSSIMPGKVNPVIPEMMNQVCFQIVGNDVSVSLAAEAGQLQLNPFQPLIAHCLLGGIDLLTAAISRFTQKCIEGIEVDENACLKHLEASVACATALVPLLGYQNSSLIASQALSGNKSVSELAAIALGVTNQQILEILNPQRLTSTQRAEI